VNPPPESLPVSFGVETSPGLPSTSQALGKIMADNINKERATTGRHHIPHPVKR
jgi:hypothetical protein